MGDNAYTTEKESEDEDGSTVESTMEDDGKVRGKNDDSVGEYVTDDSVSRCSYENESIDRSLVEDKSNLMSKNNLDFERRNSSTENDPSFASKTRSMILGENDELAGHSSGIMQPQPSFDPTMHSPIFFGYTDEKQPEDYIKTRDHEEAGILFNTNIDIYIREIF